MSASRTIRTADRQLIAVQAVLAARRYQPRVRRSKAEQDGSRGRVIRGR
jgi:hypothetical protein